jgi:hypothetical protein
VVGCPIGCITSSWTDAPQRVLGPASGLRPKATEQLAVLSAEAQG